jgi:hypothetical protein
VVAERWHKACTLLGNIQYVAILRHKSVVLIQQHWVPTTLDLSGEDVMKGLDSIVRMFVLRQGTGVRWLREELNALQVSIPLTDGCLGEFVRQADEAVKSAGSNEEQSYVERLREELAVRGRFIQTWTGSDENISMQDEETLQALVRIARKYALPRRWKLSEPVVVEYRRRRPSYWQWTNDMDSEAVPQA